MWSPLASSSSPKPPLTFITQTPLVFTIQHLLLVCNSPHISASSVHYQSLWYSLLQLRAVFAIFSHLQNSTFLFFPLITQTATAPSISCTIHNLLLAFVIFFGFDVHHSQSSLNFWTFPPFIISQCRSFLNLAYLSQSARSLSKPSISLSSINY